MDIDDDGEEGDNDEWSGEEGSGSGRRLRGAPRVTRTSSRLKNEVWERGGGGGSRSSRGSRGWDEETGDGREDEEDVEPEEETYADFGENEQEKKEADEDVQMGNFESPEEVPNEKREASVVPPASSPPIKRSSSPKPLSPGAVPPSPVKKELRKEEPSNGMPLETPEASTSTLVSEEISHLPQPDTEMKDVEVKPKVEVPHDASPPPLPPASLPSPEVDDDDFMAEEIPLPKDDSEDDDYVEGAEEHAARSAAAKKKKRFRAAIVSDGSDLSEDERKEESGEDEEKELGEDEYYIDEVQEAKYADVNFDEWEAVSRICMISCLVLELALTRALFVFRFA